VDLGLLSQEAARASAPTQVWRAADLASRLPDVLGLRPEEVWVVRPDAHAAAVALTPAAAGTALSRLLAQPASVAAA
jgi:hypothetical protein